MIERNWGSVEIILDQQRGGGYCPLSSLLSLPPHMWKNKVMGSIPGADLKIVSVSSIKFLKSAFGNEEKEKRNR